MKKLMVAAALVALGGLSLQAGVIDSVDFQSRPIGTFDINTADKGVELLWTRTADTGDSAIAGVETTPGVTNKYLKIDESDVLARQLTKDPYAIPENGGISVASKVQFTAQDADENAPTNDTAKIMLWMKKYTDDSVTPAVSSNALVVSALNSDLDREDFEFFTPALEENTWYDLEVKAQKNSAGKIGFVVKIGETVLNDGDNLFLSMIQTGDYASSIASLGFKGTGAADDLVFSTYDLEQPIHYTVTVEPEEATWVGVDATYTIDGGEAQTLNLDDGLDILASQITTSVKIDATADGYQAYTKTYTKAEFLALEGSLTITMQSAQTPTQIFIAAIDAIPEGGEGTVTLTADLALDQIVNIAGKSVTINGNYKITANGRAFNVWNGGVLTIAAGTTVEATGNVCAIFLKPTTSSDDTYTQANASTATVNVYGTVRYAGTGTPAAIQDNGNSIYGDAIINVYDGGVVENTNDAAIYKPGKGEVNIYGGTVQGTYAGIQAKAGEINISGGQVIATGANATPTELYGNGAKPSGCALQLEGNGAYAGGMTVTISGGTLSSANAAALYAYGTTAKFQSISITGGTLLAVAGQPAILNTAEAPITVSAGTFSDLSAAAYAADNATIKLANDLTVSALPTFANDTTTIDANGNLVTFTGTLALNNSVKLTNSGAMKVGDVQKGFKNNAAITIADGKTLDLSTIGWADNGLVGSDEGTPSVTLGVGASYKQALANYWQDDLTNIFTTATGYNVTLAKDAGVATITTQAGTFYVTYYTNNVECAKVNYTYGDSSITAPDVGVTTWYTENGGSTEFVFNGNTAANTQVAYGTIEAPAPQDWPDDPTSVAGKTAAEAFPNVDLPAEVTTVDADKLVIWAKGNGNVDFADAESINANAFALNADNSSTDAELQALVDAEVTQDLLDEIMANVDDLTKVDVSAITAKYPNAKVEVIPATALESTETAKFYQLKISVQVPAN